MARKSKAKQYEEEILSVIEKKKIMRFDHVFAHYTGCGRTTAYLYKLNESDAIKEALEKNRQTAVNYLLQKWIASDNSTLQIAAFKQVCSEEERQKLNQQNIDLNHSGSIEIKTSSKSKKKIDQIGND